MSELRARARGVGGLPDRRQAFFAPREFLRDAQAFRQGLPIGGLGAGEQLLDFAFQLRLDLLGMPVGQRAVARGVGVHLGPVQGHRPELQELHLLRDAKHLYEQGLNLLEEPLAERAQRIMVRVGIAREIAKRQRVVGRLLDAEQKVALIDPGFARAAVTTRLDGFVHGQDIKFVEYNAENPSSLSDQEGLNRLLFDLPAMSIFAADAHLGLPENQRFRRLIVEQEGRTFSHVS